MWHIKDEFLHILTGEAPKVAAEKSGNERDKSAGGTSMSATAIGKAASKRKREEASTADPPASKQSEGTHAAAAKTSTSGDRSPPVKSNPGSGAAAAPVFTPGDAEHGAVGAPKKFKRAFNWFVKDRRPEVESRVGDPVVSTKLFTCM